LVKKNGQPVSPEEDAKQIKQMEKRIHEIEAERKKYEERKRKRDEARARGERVNENEDTPDLIQFLRMCDFTNPRRERFRGREVIVFDSQPTPNVKPHSPDDSFIQQHVGVIWVDAAAPGGARAED